MTTPYYREKLRNAQTVNNSWVCVGLDPDPAKLPEEGFEGAVGARRFCEAIIQSTQDVVCAFKPNLAFFLAYGSEGIAALEAVIGAVPPDVPVLLDAKVGDIGSTQRRYGEAAFGTLGVDAMTVNPYVGEDAILPLLEDFDGIGLYVLARTSNPGARRFQDRETDEQALFEGVVDAARGWAAIHPSNTVGLVVGATYPGEQKLVRDRAPELPFLIPGIGAQGGDLDTAVRFGATRDGLGPQISASRSILYASGGEDFSQATREAAVALRDRINEARGAR